MLQYSGSHTSCRYFWVNCIPGWTIVWENCTVEISSKNAISHQFKLSEFDDRGNHIETYELSQSFNSFRCIWDDWGYRRNSDNNAETSLKSAIANWFIRSFWMQASLTIQLLDCMRMVVKLFTRKDGFRARDGNRTRSLLVTDGTPWPLTYRESDQMAS